MKVLDLFSGIGGISLGLERAGMRTVGFCELDPFCRSVLAKHWPEVPIYDDIRRLDAAALRGRIDLVAGGFPCQPVSVAGKRRGHEDERWLWPEMLRVVREVRPRWVLAENVPGLRTLGADRVLEDLEQEGYSCWPLVVGADDVGAPHRRKRVWIVGRLGLADGDCQRVGHPDELRREQRASRTGETDAGRSSADVAYRAERGCDAEPRHDLPRSTREATHEERKGSAEEYDRVAREGRGMGTAEPLAHGDGRGRGRCGEQEPTGLVGAPGDLADGCGARGTGPEVGHAEEPRLEGLGEGLPRSAGGELGNATEPRRDGRSEERDIGIAEEEPLPTTRCQWPSRPGEQQFDWEAPRLIESDLGLFPDGLPGRLAPRDRRARLKALGNSVVPPLVEAIGVAIMRANEEVAA